MNLDHLFQVIKPAKVTCSFFQEDLVYLDKIASGYNISRSHCMKVMLNIYFDHYKSDKEIPRATRKQEADRQIVNIRLPMAVITQFQAHRQNMGCTVTELTHEAILMHQQLTDNLQ